jgi:hypothetical protein
MTRRSMRLAIVLTSVLTATAAGAQTEDRKASPPAEPLVFGSGSTYEVKFDDDPLGALGSGTIVPRLTVRFTEHGPRLHRPRTQFVAEMLKSVDAI